MRYKRLGRKQSEDNQRFQHVWENIDSIISKYEVDKKASETLRTIERLTNDKKCGYGWSGGKDSIALQILMERIGIDKCVMGMTHDLEYPEMLRWVTDHMPDELDVYDSGLSLEWLSSNLDMLFPKDSRVAAKWFKLIQHKAQAQFFVKHDLDILLLGRRKLDTNYTGPAGANIYTNGEGITRYSPISDWTHEEILGLIYYSKRDLPPLYRWPNGWIVGSGCWAARQWTGSIEKAWSEVYTIDPEIVRRASLQIPSALKFLQR